MRKRAAGAALGGQVHRTPSIATTTTDVRDASCSRRRSCFALTRQVRHDPENPLNQHQLSAMVHLVLLHAEDHFESGLRDGCTGGGTSRVRPAPLA